MAYYSEFYYLIESLATIKSVILALDVPGGDDVITGFFKTFIEIVRCVGPSGLTVATLMRLYRPDMSKTLIRHLVHILAAVLEEGQTVPSGAMDIIIDQFENHASVSYLGRMILKCES